MMRVGARSCSSIPIISRLLSIDAALDSILYDKTVSPGRSIFLFPQKSLDEKTGTITDRLRNLEVKRQRFLQDTAVVSLPMN